MTQVSPSIKNEPRTKIDERLGRVETLLEKLVEKEQNGSESEDHRYPSTPEDGRELLPQISSNAANIHEQGPFLSLVDHSVGGRRDGISPGENNDTSPGKISSNTGASKLGKTRQILSALLPSQKDANFIAESTGGWELSLLYYSHDPDRSDDPLAAPNLSVVAEREPAIIARTLLYVAICIQQLPPEFDSSQLQMCEKTDPMDIAETYASTVASLITTNDTLSTTIPGFQCLILQSLFHKFAGHLQRSWMTVRRAITVAQLLNIHSEYLKPLTEDNFVMQKANNAMWEQAVRRDRYLGMLMGLPPGTSDDCFGDLDHCQHDSIADREGLFWKKLCITSSALTKRNQMQDIKDYAATQRIDQQLDIISGLLPPSWWEIPLVTNLERSLSLSRKFDQMTTQMWFFQQRSLLHLPFLLREDLQNNYEYSRLSCVNASREFIVRYLALRKMRNTQIMCKTLDFGAFIACVIMILGQLRSRPAGREPHETPMEKGEDEDLIREIISSMALIARSKREVVIRESVVVLKTLLETNTSSKKLRLTIPYVGTISVLRDHHADQSSAGPAPAPRTCSISSIIDHQKLHISPDQSSIPPGANGQGWQGTHGYSPSPYLSFDPSFEEDQMPMGWEPEPPEEIFFYSMMGSDVGGEWIF